MKRRNLQSGFALFEILISIAIMGLIMGIAVSGMDRYLETDMKAACNKMAATMRYIYNKSATEGMYIRLVLDLTDQVYWVEATMDPVMVVKQDDEMARASSKGDEDKEEKESSNQKKGMFDDDANKIKPKEPIFGAVDSYLLKATKLPDGIFFKDVYVEHLIFPVDSGKVAIFFFPNGYVEEAVINLRDEDDELNYSLLTNPISGRVKIENFYRTLEEK